MMYMSSTLTNGLDDILAPSFRAIHFERANAQNTVVTLLRRAWRALPPDDIDSGEDTADALRKYMQNESRREEGAPPISAENPDKDSVDTEWRKAILYHYNHFFYDAGNLMQEANCAMGYFDPPNHSHFVLTYEDLAAAELPSRVFDTNVVILPAFLDDGLKLCVSRVGESDATLNRELMVMDEEHMQDAWFIRKDMRITFKIDEDQQARISEASPLKKGVAAVIVVGILSNTDMCASHEAGELESEE